MIVPIASIEQGARVRVAGVVRASEPLLTSSLSNKPCVYWDVRRGLHDPPSRSEAQRFWLEDESGRALVSVEGANVAAHAERQREVMRVAEADHEAASARIREIKDALKTVHGPEAARLHKERAALAKVVTLMLAIRAHARGRVHIAGTLSEQERWIREHVADASDREAVKLMVESWEVVIEEGQRIEIEGVVGTEAMPPGALGGYRDRPTCVAIRAESVTGIGALAPRAEEPVLPRTKKRASEFERAVIGILAALLAAAILLYLLRL